MADDPPPVLDYNGPRHDEPPARPAAVVEMLQAVAILILMAAFAACVAGGVLWLTRTFTPDSPFGGIVSLLIGLVAFQAAFLFVRGKLKS